MGDAKEILYFIKKAHGTGITFSDWHACHNNGRKSINVAISCINNTFTNKNPNPLEYPLCLIIQGVREGVVTASLTVSSLI